MQAIPQDAPPDPTALDDDENDGTPLCLRCLRPVGRLMHVCPTCGAAVGQLTPYLPLEHIRWEAGVWGRMWRQIADRKCSIVGRVMRIGMIAMFAPFLVVGLVPLLWSKASSATTVRE